MRHVLLRGAPGAGKTTVARATVGLLCSRGWRVAGFVAEEVRGDDGARRGFDLILLAADGSDRERLSLARKGMASPVTVGRYGIDVEVMEAALPTLQQPADVRVIDELGAMELAHPETGDAVEAAFDGPVPVLATVHQRRHPVTDALVARDDAMTVQVTPTARNALPQRVASLLERGMQQATTD